MDNAVNKADSAQDKPNPEGKAEKKPDLPNIRAEFDKVLNIGALHYLPKT